MLRRGGVEFLGVAVAAGWALAGLFGLSQTLETVLMTAFGALGVYALFVFMRRAVTDLGQTIVMVTHDPVAASYADRIVFLADGKIVDEMREPTAERVLDRMKNLGN